MNKIVAISAAAAVPTIAPALSPTADASAIDPIFAVLDAFRRVDAEFFAVAGEDIPDELGDRHHAAVKAMLRTCPTTPAGLAALTTWAREQLNWQHSQSSCWYTEDLCALVSTIDDAARGMSGLEPWSPPAVHIAPDAKLFALADQYLAAQKRYRELSYQVDQMERQFKYRESRGPVPTVLHWRESDAEIGMPALYPKPDDHLPIWDRPIDVDKIRDEEWWTFSKVHTDTEITESAKKIRPSAAARVRADEIIAAFDKWKVEGKPPRGYRKAVREMKQADKAWGRLEIGIRDTRASTVEGMIAKMRCARAYEGWADEDVQDGPPHQMALSIMDDLQALARTA
jgi:hypothetical protein